MKRLLVLFVAIVLCSSAVFGYQDGYCYSTRTLGTHYGPGGTSQYIEWRVAWTRTLEEYAAFVLDRARKEGASDPFSMIDGDDGWARPRFAYISWLVPVDGRRMRYTVTALVRSDGIHAGVAISPESDWRSDAETLRWGMRCGQQYLNDAPPVSQ
jgi:hypothetical protein